MRDCILRIIFVSGMLLSFSIYACAGDILKVIPQEAMTVFILQNRKNDPGLDYIKDILNEKLTQTKDASKRRAVEDLSRMLGVDRVVSAAFYNQAKPLFLLAIEAKDKKILQSLTDKIDILFDNPKQIWQEKYLDYRVIYNPRRFNKPGKKDLSCYALLDSYIIIANDFGILKKAIDTYKCSNPAITASKDFTQSWEGLKKDYDAVMYITNQNHQLANSLNSWKRQMGFVLFTSADILKSVWVYFDLVDKDNIQGKIVFSPSAEDPQARISNDAQYLVEAMRRKFMAENLNYTTSIDAIDKDIVLNVKITNTGSFLKKLLISEDVESSIDVKTEIYSKPKKGK